MATSRRWFLSQAALLSAASTFAPFAIRPGEALDRENREAGGPPPYVRPTPYVESRDPVRVLGPTPETFWQVDDLAVRAEDLAVRIEKEWELQFHPDAFAMVMAPLDVGDAV